MNLDDDAIVILKNFAMINQGMIFELGKPISVMSVKKNMIGEAVINNKFDRSFAIHDMPQLLACIGLFTDPILTFEDNFILITSPGQQLKYFYTAPALVEPPATVAPLDKGHIINTEISAADLKMLMQAVGVLQVPQIIITNDIEPNKITFGAVKEDDRTHPSFQLHTSDWDSSDTFRFVFDMEKIMMLMNDDYSVTISDVGISLFESKNRKLKYWISMEQKGSFYNE